MVNVKCRFLWIGMRKQLDIFDQTCTMCKQFKLPGKSRKAALKDYRKGEPMKHVCIDLVGPFVVSGHFIKYVELYPIPNQEAETVAQVLTESTLGTTLRPR